MLQAGMVAHLEVERTGRPPLASSAQQHPPVTQVEIVQHMCGSSFVVACNKARRDTYEPVM